MRSTIAHLPLPTVRTQSPCFCVPDDYQAPGLDEGLSSMINSVRPRDGREALRQRWYPEKVASFNWSNQHWPPQVATLQPREPSRIAVGCPTSHQLRCIPRLFNFGPPKTGSSSLFSSRRAGGFIMRHPSMALGPVKELCPVWSSDGGGGSSADFSRARLVEWSRWFDPRAARGSALISGCNELSWAPDVHDFDRFVSSLLPTMRILVVMREPASRAYSHFACCFVDRRAMLEEGKLTPTFFHELMANATKEVTVKASKSAAQSSVRLYRDRTSIMARCFAEWQPYGQPASWRCHALHVLLLPGVYAGALGSLRHAGWPAGTDGSQPVLAVVLEQLGTHAGHQTFARALGRLLGLDPAPWLKGKVGRVNTRDYGKGQRTPSSFSVPAHMAGGMMSQTRELLQSFFAPHNAALAHELGLSQPLWPSSDSEVRGRPTSAGRQLSIARQEATTDVRVASKLPCCSQLRPEQSIAGRCKYKASQGECTNPAARALCPVACGMCTPCKLETVFCSPGSKVHDAPNISDNAWCATWPRCDIYGCCDRHVKRRHVPSTQRFVRPSNTETGHAPVGDAPHARAACAQSQYDLEMGLAALPYTTSFQFDQLAEREEFRILYLVQGMSASLMPAEYSVFLRRPERHLLFLSFHQDAIEVAAPLCPKGNRVCRRLRGRTVHFPGASVGDGRNMLYLLARELEIHQGWLFNYFVFLDDDEEFALRPHNASMLRFTAFPVPIIDVATHTRQSSTELLHSKLRDYERWLRFMQPVVGSLCWGACGEQHSARSICHPDHKFLAWHREGVETLWPMMMARDRGPYNLSCWWASQWAQTVEISIHFRNHMLYYPGELQVRNSLPMQAKGILRPAEAEDDDMPWMGGKHGIAGRYEKHAEYPRHCDNTYWQPGAFANVYQDLRDHLYEWAGWSVDSLSCLDRFAEACYTEQGLSAGPALIKAHPYYHISVQPKMVHAIAAQNAPRSNSARVARANDTHFARPCTSTELERKLTAPRPSTSKLKSKQKVAQRGYYMLRGYGMRSKVHKDRLRHPVKTINATTPCCAKRNPEFGVGARCKLKVQEAGGAGRCGRFLRSMCPVRCGACILCATTVIRT